MPLGHGSLDGYDYIPGRKASPLDRTGDSCGVKGYTRFGEHFCFALDQVDFSTINAIQALEGLLDPVRSKRSMHAVNLDDGMLHLRERRNDAER